MTKADREYLSFYAKEYSYLGGAHGNTVIRVGTISRAMKIDPRGGQRRRQMYK